MSGPATLDDLRKMVVGSVRKIGRGFTEVLVLTVGDAESEETWYATIGRDHRHVRTIGQFERMEGYAIAGRFVGLNEYLGRPR